MNSCSPFSGWWLFPLSSKPCHRAAKRIWITPSEWGFYGSTFITGPSRYLTCTYLTLFSYNVGQPSFNESNPAICFVIKELPGDSSKAVKLGFLAGLVPREKSMAFERILFRATRGNVFLRQTAVEDPVTDPVSGEKVLICVPLVYKI